MISFFRRIFSSKVGLVLTLLFVALIAVAFAAGDLSGVAGGGNALSGTTIAEVGDREIGDAEAQRQIENQLSARQQQNPTLDMAAFISGGGFEGVLDQLIEVRALEAFARETGIRAGKRLVDGEIASIPTFFGATGKFDQAAFNAFLQNRRLTEQQVRDDIAAGLVARQIELPAYGAARMPARMVQPYAALSLEARRGLSALIPVAAIPQGAPPSAQELGAYYQRNLARYTVPERRIIRYALFGRDQLGDAARPTEAEIAGYYRTNAARYGASERRTLTQVIVPDQAAANALAGRVRGGATMAAAAAAAGVEPLTQPRLTRAGYGGTSTAQVAQAAFAAPQGTVTAPIRGPLGWYVVRVDAVTPVPARTLDQVRGEIAQQLGAQKLQQALADQAGRIDDAIADSQTFDEIVAANRLQVVTTPPVTASGTVPGDPQYRPDPTFARFLAPMFQSEPDDDPAIETLVPQQQYALADLDRVIPATPRPLAEIRAQVAQDFVAERAYRRAGEIARAVTAKVARGTPLTQALRETNLPLPAPRRIGGSRRDLTASGQPIGPDTQRLFEMAARTAKRVEASNRQGWYVVYLEGITPGDPRTDPPLVARMQGDFAQLIGREYAEQLAEAAKRTVGVERNDAAARALKQRMAGTGGQ